MICIPGVFRLIAPGGSLRAGLAVALVLAMISVAAADSPDAAPPAAQPAVRANAPSTLHIARISEAIDIDGSLGEPAWKSASRVDTWYETNPGDNTEPRIKNVGYLAYDDEYLYAGFEFEDPQPDDIRSPIRDRDNVPRDHDYGGVIIDPSDTGRTAIEMLVNARGVQYDAVYDDNGNEDTSPDFYWDAATQIRDHGWTLEIRVPFSSLRYPHKDPQTWRIMLYRNYPRDFRYQFFTTVLPRGRNCFICWSNVLDGLERLPTGGGIVFAPYASSSYDARPSRALGSSLDNAFDAAGGFDVRWQPNASNVVNATINPDFSQIESDVAQITANERFALSYPEKRPFFLEASELFATPIQAVYTRSITDPLWGARATGRVGNLSYTTLVAQDEGGGSVIIPHRNSSEQVDQDFRSWVGIARLRYELGRSYAGLLVTDREVDGGGHNRLIGPDFLWRWGDGDRLGGQLLGTWTRTPDRMDLSPEWDATAHAGYAGRVEWRHSTLHVDWDLIYQEIGDRFRADDGYVPQSGYREGYAQIGYTFRPDSGPFRRVHPFSLIDRGDDLDHHLLAQDIQIGADADGLWNSTTRLAYTIDRIRAGDKTLPRQQLAYTFSVSPSIIVARIDLMGTVGQQIDFDNARTGTGADIGFDMTVQPTPHLELLFNESLRWLDVDVGGSSERLFTARIDRLRATYSFSSRVFLRVIGQYQVMRRDPALYTTATTPKDATLSGSALFSFKLNWQSVLFVGYGDTRVFSDMSHELEPQARQLFIKLSYAFQR